MFATLVVETEPLTWADVPAAIGVWLQDAGILAAIALAIWCLAYAFQKPAALSKHWSLEAGLFIVASCASAVFYVLFFLVLLVQGTLPGTGERGAPRWSFTTVQQLFLTLAGGCALFAATMPVVLDLVRRVRFRRVWALARLSLKEALRRKVLWVFALIALVFLFAEWFLEYKPEHQLHGYVRVLFFSMAVLFLIVACLLGAFSIPTDVKNQTIHTIVTKPVERYEIVLGRFLGYGLLLTAALAVITGLSLLYLLRGLTPEAREESYKARVPAYGARLDFYRTKGESVGREWEYRRYITGPSPQAPDLPLQYAQWFFTSLPGDLADREKDVPLEFTFDIFRTTKGEEGKGVYCTFIFAGGQQRIEELEALKEQRGRALGKPKMTPAEVDREFIDKHGYYEVAGVEVTDYHTQKIEIPARLFKKLLQDAQERGPDVLGADGKPAAVMQVAVSVDPVSRTQLVGVARRDLYLLTGELPFELNFIKGAIGLWFTMMLLLGLALALSTYLSGIISFICAGFLFLLGLLSDFIRSVAEGAAVGGGPWEATYRLLGRHNLTAPLDPSPTLSVLQIFDTAYGWALRLFLKIIPDVNRFDLTQYVANGFNISLELLVCDCVLPLLGYLIPWAVLAYYLMKFREVANPT
jgi:ABC-type transport system involved in multi-copper enzyme maturation permease subunit